MFRAFATSASTVRPVEAATIASAFAPSAADHAFCAPATESRSSSGITSIRRPPTPPCADRWATAAETPARLSAPLAASGPVRGPTKATR